MSPSASTTARQTDSRISAGARSIDPVARWRACRNLRQHRPVQHDARLEQAIVQARRRRDPHPHAVLAAVGERDEERADRHRSGRTGARVERDSVILAGVGAAFPDTDHDIRELAASATPALIEEHGDVGVESNARHVEERLTIGPADVDGERTIAKRDREREVRVERHAQRGGETVARSCGNQAERRPASREGAADFVHGPVSAPDDRRDRRARQRPAAPARGRGRRARSGARRPRARARSARRGSSRHAERRRSGSTRHQRRD